MSQDMTTPASLQALERKWEQITEIPESPRTLMGVIEYSLGSQRKAEVYVNRLLKYFLDPSEPHGMDTEFLRVFLQALPSDCEFQEDIHGLSDVQVDDQVQVSKVVDEEAESTGIVDLCIEVPNEWFLLIELKFSAEDTQTEFYYREATHVGDRAKDDYESDQYYLYLHQDDQPTANEPEFTNWTWQAVTTDVLEPFLVENVHRYPQRTANQLREFTDDIQTIAGMTDHQQTDQEKIELYLDYYGAIKDVTDSFNERWEMFTDEWGTQLGTALEADDRGSASDAGEYLTVVNLDLEDPALSNWTFRSSSSDWGMIFKKGWWRHTDDLENVLDGRPDDRNDVRIGFHHRLERNRDLALGEHTLKFYFRNMGANDRAFRDTFTETIDDRQEKLASLLPAAAELTGNKRNMIEATYDIDPDAHADFFDAYIAALKEAFIDHVVESEDLISALDGSYYKSIEEVYGVSLRS